jgi:maltose-binding protein MalE
MKAMTSFVCAIAIAVASVSLLAHQETFKGTVIAAESASVRVNVVDPKSKAETPRTFTINAQTRVLRGDAVVTLANAKIQANENISVTVDHDVDVNRALVIRLDAAR